MSDAARIQRLSADVDHLISAGGQLDGAAGDPDHAQLLDLAKQLATLDLAGDAALRTRIRRRLSATLASQDRPRSMSFLKQKGASQMLSISKRRRVFWSTVPALALLALMLAFTPLQAFAREVLVRIGLVNITNEPTSVEEFLRKPPAKPQSGAPTAQPPVLSSAQVYKPSYLPAGYKPQPGYRGMQYVRQGDAGTDYLRVYTLDPEHQRLAVGEAAVTRLTVRGVDGAYVAGAPLYVKDLGGPMLHEEIEPALVNLVLWEEAGQIVVVESGALGQEELVRVAEGLR